MSLLGLFFPKYCVVCRRTGSYLCDSCFSRISFDFNCICLVCGRASFDGKTHPVCRSNYAPDGVSCGVAFNIIAKKLVYVSKYPPYVADVIHIMSDLLYESLIQQESFLQVFSSTIVFVPIPLFSTRLKQRGYNQSLLLANYLAERYKKSRPLDGIEEKDKQSLTVIECLIRVKDTTPQSDLKKEERSVNIKSAFILNKKFLNIIKDKQILLIDDVLTTGSTLLEASKVLKRNGAKSVWGVTFARD